MPGYSPNGRINALIKFENNRLTIIDGFLLQNQGGSVTLKPLNQLGTIYQNSEGKWVSEKLTFQDELFRQPKTFRPSCNTLYNSHQPQMHLLTFNYDGKLQIKQVIVDPSSSAKNTYTEMLTFSGIED